ncbi:MAG TPA: glycine cleavage T C-terminal barrel domain-containing protein, partial [Bacillota bacterium]
NPWEAGLDAFVKLDKGDFIGRDALLRVRASGGPRRRLVGLELSERGIARHGYPVTDLDGRPIGHVTSGTLSPTLGRSLALAYVPSQLAGVGSELAVVIHGRPRRARVVPTPFYRRGQA